MKDPWKGDNKTHDGDDRVSMTAEKIVLLIASASKDMEDAHERLKLVCDQITSQTPVFHKEAYAAYLYGFLDGVMTTKDPALFEHLETLMAEMQPVFAEAIKSIKPPKGYLE